MLMHTVDGVQNVICFYLFLKSVNQFCLKKLITITEPPSLPDPPFPLPQKSDTNYQYRLTRLKTKHIIAVML